MLNGYPKDEDEFYQCDDQNDGDEEDQDFHRYDPDEEDLECEDADEFDIEDHRRQ